MKAPIERAPDEAGRTGAPSAAVPAGRAVVVAARRRALRPLVVTAVLGSLTVFAVVWHIAVGGSPIPTADVFATLLGAAPDPRTELAVLEFRAPRTAAAVLAGLALGASGALTQTVARNPLASPDILGITAGASLGAVAVLALAGTAGGISGAAAMVGLPAGATIAGVGTAAAVYLLTWRGGLESNRVIIVGLGLSGLAAALTGWMLTLGDVTNAAQALTWMSGSINGRDWAQIATVAAPILLGLAAAVTVRRQLDFMALGEDTVRALGVRPNLVRLWLLALATVLAVGATVLAGPVAFVALASPQIARLLLRSVLPPVTAAALVGALFVLLADLAAAHLLPAPLPAGVATAVLGAPYLIFLVMRQQRGRRS